VWAEAARAATQITRYAPYRPAGQTKPDRHVCARKLTDEGHDVLLRHQFADDKEAILGKRPDLKFDFFDAADFEAFSPDVIIIERSILNLRFRKLREHAVAVGSRQKRRKPPMPSISVVNLVPWIWSVHTDPEFLAHAPASGCTEIR